VLRRPGRGHGWCSGHRQLFTRAGGAKGTGCNSYIWAAKPTGRHTASASSDQNTCFSELADPHHASPALSCDFDGTLTYNSPSHYRVPEARRAKPGPPSLSNLPNSSASIPPIIPLGYLLSSGSVFIRYRHRSPRAGGCRWLHDTHAWGGTTRSARGQAIMILRILKDGIPLRFKRRVLCSRASRGQACSDSTLY
jgi:hypothetical protein